MKSTLFLVILLIILAEGNITGYSEGQRSQYTQTGGSFLDRFSHRRITHPGGRYSCQGFAEIRSEFNGTETVFGKIVKEEVEDAPKKAGNLRYRVPGGRSANITIKVQGNCCWKFYQK